MIPKQLKSDKINLVLIERGGKRPFETGWQKKKIKFNDEKLLKHLVNGGNYGVLGGGVANLVVIDFDDEALQQTISPLLPKTFTVKSGRGLFHKYFFSDASDSFKLFNEEMDTLADIQGTGKQVVGPNSTHPNGNKYLVVDDSPITFMPYAEIQALLQPYNKKAKKIVEKKPIKELTYNNISTNFVDVVKSRVSMTDVLSRVGVDTGKSPTNCPFHDSKGGKCFGFNNDTWHCFHCDESGNIFSMIMKEKSLDFKECLLWFAEEFNLKSEFDDCKQRYFKEIATKELDELKVVKYSFTGLVFGKEKKWPEATELLVKTILEHFNVYTTKDDLKSEVWVYDDGIYIPQGRSQIKEFLRKVLEEFYSSFVFNKVMDKIEPDTFIVADEFFSNNLVDELPVLNGVLNIKTKVLGEFTPKKVFFAKLPVTYDPAAKCKAIDLFLSQVLKKDHIKVFYELAGFSLLKDYTYEKAFMFTGKGRNGKSKALELLKRFVGSSNVCSVPLTELKSDSFSVGELFGKLINLAGDISNTDLKDTGMLKQVTGRDIIAAKRKFMRDLNFINHAKLVFACNELPMVYDFSRGFWDRWVLIDFPFTFVKQPELTANPDDKSLKLLDPNIMSKISSPIELSGLLNMALASLDVINDHSGFSYDLDYNGVKNMWIRRSNSFYAFCYDELDANYDSQVGKKALRKSYYAYCKRFKVRGKSNKVIKAVLGELFGVVDERTDFEGDWAWVWDGLKFKEKGRAAEADEILGELID